MAAAKTKKQEQLTLDAKKRTITGKKVRKLRREGIVPANIFGTGFTSMSIEIPVTDFVHTYKVARETGIVNIKVDKASIPTLVRDVQRHPVSREILHVEFRKIDLKKKIETQVPVEMVGTSIAITQKGGVLLTQINELTIEALPSNIPEHIEIDISSLKEIGDEVKIGDLPKQKEYTIVDESDKTIVSAIEHKEESVTPETTTESPEVLTEKDAEEGGEASPDKTADETKDESDKK